MGEVIHVAEKKMNIAMLGHKHMLSREGGVEIVVRELATRMAARGHAVTCYDRRTSHVSGEKLDNRSGRFENNKHLTEYIESHLGHQDDALDFQINAFKAYWLMMAVFHEVKCGRRLTEAAGHIRRQIRLHRPLDSIRIRELPLAAGFYMVLLKMKLYYTTLICTRIVQSGRR